MTWAHNGCKISIHNKNGTSPLLSFLSFLVWGFWNFFYSHMDIVALIYMIGVKCSIMCCDFLFHIKYMNTCTYTYMRGNSPTQNWNYLLEGRPIIVQASPTRWVFSDSICISVPADIVVRSCIQVQWIFLKSLSPCLPISWWVIYEHTCPHHTECSVVFD